MTVNYPRKLQNALSARDILKIVVLDRELNLLTQIAIAIVSNVVTKDLTDLIELLDGKPKELVRDLSRHISDEARHAMWLTAY